MAARAFGLLLAALAGSGVVAHAQSMGLAPATSHFKDEATGAETDLFTIAADPAKTAPDSAADPAALATLTIQCTQVRNHRTMDLFFNPTGGIVTSIRTLDTSSSAIPNPNAKILLDMDGTKKFKLVWERLPSGEYHYRNPGGSSNLLSPLFLLQWMYATRVLRVQVPGDAATPEFHEANLVATAYQSPLCKP
jgi:hypothetical protein